MSHEPPYVTRLRNLLSQITQHSVEDFCANGRHGDLKFSELEHDVRSVHSIFTEVEKLPLSSFCESIVNRIESGLGPVVHRMSSVRSFDIFESHARERKTNLIAHLRDDVPTMIQVVIPFIAYGHSLQSPLEKSLDKVVARVTQRESEINVVVNSAKEAISTIEKRLAEATDAAKDAREAATITGVSAHSSRFSELSNAHTKAGTLWLIASWSSLALTAILVHGLFIGDWLAVQPLAESVQSSAGNTEPVWIHGFAAKLAVLAVALTGVAWTARSYRINRHLAVVNSHRARALDTFNAFAHASKDQAVKDAILLEAAKCIFGRVSSGYLNSQADVPSDRVIEVLKTTRG